MCFVSFVPLSDTNYVLSSNRDESPLRSIHELGKELINGHELIFPKDSKGGSWIFASHKNVSLCLLNGALEKHKHDPPYKLSRGIMLKDYFNYSNTREFVNQYDFEGIEPFTCVVIEQGSLYEIYWNETEITLNKLPFNEVHLWSSSPLYTTALKLEREKWFFELYRKINYPVPDDIRNIHLTGGSEDPENGFVMNRKNRVCTVSFSQISRIGNTMYLSFQNLLEKDHDEIHRSFNIASS
jgi:hypothetical protein